MLSIDQINNSRGSDAAKLIETFNDMCTSFSEQTIAAVHPLITKCKQNAEPDYNDIDIIRSNF